MKHKICMLVLASVFTVLSFAQQPLVSAPKDGPGPLCWPGDPCSTNSILDVSKDGAPMCIPGMPCAVTSDSVIKVIVTAPKDGSPLCWPGDPCSVNSILSAPKDGLPQCFPGFPCGNV